MTKQALLERAGHQAAELVVGLRQISHKLQIIDAASQQFDLVQQALIGPAPPYPLQHLARSAASQAIHG